ncbi:MAG: hypothetical protein ACK2T6_02085 [Anaerolineae bacterium]
MEALTAVRTEFGLGAARRMLAIVAVAGAIAAGLAQAPVAEASFGDEGIADLVIREGDGNGDVIVETREGTAYLGNAATSEPLLTYRNGRIFVGARPGELEVFRVKRGCLRAYATGGCALTMKGDRVRMGHTGPVQYEFRGDQVYVSRYHALMKADTDLEQLNEETKWMIVALLEMYVVHTP